MVGCIPTIQRTIKDLSNYADCDIRPGDHWANREIVGSRWTGVHHWPNEEPLEDAALLNCQLRWAEKWLSRMYRVKQILIANCEFLDVLHEHACYWNIAGGMPANDRGSKLAILFHRTVFRNISSQAIQMVSPWDGNPDRSEPHETIDPEADREPGLGVKLQEIYAENVGAATGHSRAGFAFSFFPMPNDVWFDRVRLENRMQTKSEGGFMVHKRHTPTSRFRMEHSTFKMGDLQKPLGQLRDIENVLIQDSEFTARAGQAWIDIDRCPNVTIRRCHGNVNVHRDGVDLGPIEELTLK